MARAKKVEIEGVEEVEQEVVVVPTIGKIEIEFNNESLNQLRDKLNEVIEFVNK